MKSRTLAAISMLLLFAIACFVIAPALHAEHPWDADNKPLDNESVQNMIDSLNSQGADFDEDDPPAWFWTLWFSASSFLAGQYW